MNTSVAPSRLYFHDHLESNEIQNIICWIRVRQPIANVQVDIIDYFGLYVDIYDDLLYIESRLFWGTDVYS